MLTKEDFHQNLRFISLGCKLGIFPLRVDFQCAELQLLQSKWRQVTCQAFLGLVAMHATYVVARLPYVLLNGPEISTLFLLWHLTLIFGMLGVLYWHFVAFFQWPGITAACFNRVFDTWGFEDQGNKKAGLWGHITGWTLQELLAVAYPYAVTVSVALILTLYCFEQDMPTLIYSSLPEKFKTPAWFAVCLLQETNQLFYCMSSATIIFQLHILLQEALKGVLRNLLETSRCYSSRKEACWIIGKIRNIQLLVNLFNTGHRNVIYCLKVMCISMATVNGYGAIAYSGVNAVFGVLTLSVAVDAIFLYAFVYEKASAIPDTLESMKRNLEVRVRTLSSGKDKAILLREIFSIPSVGLRVGDFHTLERISTPIFIQYVVTGIVNLLVML